MFRVANRPDGQGQALVAARPAIEWPTLVVIVAIYASFFALTFFHRSIPIVLLLLGLGLVTAWHGSLQHELLHGHGVRNAKISFALSWLSTNLWLPFADYRDTHLQHHIDANLTDPFDDPESTYRSPSEWSRLSRPMQMILWANRTLIGRFFLGPILVICRYLRHQFAAVQASNSARRIWLSHLFSILLTTIWVVGVCDLSIWNYVLGATYLGTSFTLIRSFVEHICAENVSARTAIVRSRGPLALLFLNNNFHVTHHERPDAPWYRLPALTKELNNEAVAAEGAGLFRSYLHVFARFAVSPRCQPVRPKDVGRMNPPTWRRVLARTEG